MRAPSLRLVFVAFSMWFVGASLAQDLKYGRFVGAIQTEWIKGKDDERRMKLLQDVTYIDAAGTRWMARKDFVTDGASIPRAFWSIVGGPLDGPYRDAALFHDAYCVSKVVPWQAVHRMFYEASLAAGVSPSKAKILYAAVYVGGPRWSGCPTCLIGLKPELNEMGKPLVRPALSEDDAQKFADWIEANSPSIEQINAYVSTNYPSMVRN